MFKRRRTPIRRSHENRSTVVIIMMHLLALSCFDVCAEGRIVSPGYRWESGHTYRYRVIVAKQATNLQERVVSYVCLSNMVEGAATCSVICVETKNLKLGGGATESEELLSHDNKMPSFIAVDLRGVIKWQKLSQPAEAKMTPAQISSVIYAGRGLDLGLVFPARPIEIGAKWTNMDERYVFELERLSVTEQGEIAWITRKKGPPFPGAPEASQFETVEIAFDLQEGHIAKVSSRLDEERALAVVLDSVTATSHAELQALTQAFDRAISKDAFIKQTCVAQWLDTKLDIGLLRGLYRLLREVDDDVLREAMAKEGLRLWPHAPVAYDIMKDVISSIKDRESWAVSVLVETMSTGNDDIGSLAYDQLCDLAGVKLEKNQAAWRDWLAKQRQGLPRLLTSNREELDVAMKNSDPQVRLFALRQLTGRNDPDMEPLLEKAASDSDEKVRAFATSSLKKLKEKSKEKNK